MQWGKRLAPAMLTAIVQASAISTAALPANYNGDEVVVRESVLARRDFPFLMKLLANEPVRQVMERDPDFAAMTQARWQAAATAAAHCGSSAACEGQALLFTPQQVAQGTDALRHLYRSSAAARLFADEQLKPIQEFSLTPAPRGEDVLVDNWTRSAAGINLIIQRYCEGQAPHYSVDTSLYPKDSGAWGRLVQILVEGLAVPAPHWAEHSGTAALFFEPSLRFAIRLLEAESMDYAGRFWPLRDSLNAAAVRHLPSIHWAQYSYSVIVVPGSGPQLPDAALSPWGKERLRLAVAAFRSGAAPLLLVSGGFVHPPHTRFSEAVEMRRYLQQAFEIPDSAILVDPYARHTTTNLRNAVREIMGDGIPLDRPMLIVSDADQIDYVQSPRFAARCQEELGYLPVALLKRLSPTSMSAVGSKQSLFRDPQDPLDP
ncbi:MAG: YdcF family protein [Acidobacteriota bacterium]